MTSGDRLVIWAYRECLDCGLLRVGKNICPACSRWGFVEYKLKDPRVFTYAPESNATVRLQPERV